MQNRLYCLNITSDHIAEHPKPIIHLNITSDHIAEGAKPIVAFKHNRQSCAEHAKGEHKVRPYDRKYNNYGNKNRSVNGTEI